MAYAAVTCLRSTIRRLQNCSHISVVLPTRTHLELAYEELGSLQKVLKRSGGNSSCYGDSLNALDGEITVLVQKLEDSLELHELNSLCNSMSYGDVQMVNDIVNSVEKVKNITQKYIEELGIPLPDDDNEEEGEEENNDEEEEDNDGDEEQDDEEEEEEEEEDNDEQDDEKEEEEEEEEDNDGDEEQDDEEEKNNDGDDEQDDEKEEEEEDNDGDDEQDEEEEEEEEEENNDDGQKEEEKKEEDDGGGGDVNPLKMVGLSDKFEEITWTLVQDEGTYLFSIIGMAGIGKTALAERILQDPSISDRFEYLAFIKVGQEYDLQTILAQLNPNKDESLDSFLDDQRHFIVLDDVWDLDVWHDYFKHRGGAGADKGSRILLTTRLESLVLTLGKQSYFYMPFLNKEESWELLRIKVFPNRPCPTELENPGMEIANKCEGLPLMIVTVAQVLSEAPEMTPEYWLEAARKRSRNRVLEDAYDRILPVLYPSYNNLPAQTKTCFLYMAAFPPGHQIRRSRLVNLWCTEGFLEPDDDDDESSLPPAASASECFDSLNLDHVVVPAPHLSSNGQDYQACSLHSVFRHLCRKELYKNQLLHIIDGPNINNEQEEERNCSRRRRRIAVYHNVLLSIEDVRRSIGLSPNARSLLCTGHYHQYQVRIDFDLRLLRVCDALTIRFYEFPLEVLKLVQLRYFAITCNKNLPPCISKLWKLEYLIVHQHSSIKTSLAESSYVPVEIWDLQELRHLQLIGRNLPTPPHVSTDAIVLPHLVKLLDVGPCSCSEAVLSSIPNLQKLRVQIHLTPNHSVEPLSNLSNISTLHRLVSLQCVIVNPAFTSQDINVAKPSSLSFSPSSLEKLTLNGLGHPWKYLNELVKLPNLRVLKLLCHAFRGENWVVPEKGFLNLQCLLIEDSDLVQWISEKESFPVLSHLKLSSCYKLKKFPNLSSLVQIELVDCNPAAVTCAEQADCEYVTSSWDDEEGDHLNYISKIYTTLG